MSLELVHSSVERGLRGGSGFSTVVVTAGMPPELEKILAELSAYDFDEKRALGADTVEWAHRVVNVQGRSHTVLSRVAPCGADQSGRGNRVAHHLVVEPSERCEAGPAWSLERFGAFARTPPAPEERPVGPVIGVGELAPRRAMAWHALGLDPGWAGVVARAVLDTPVAPIYLVFPRSVELLGAMCDISSLLPRERRWLFTFTTRYQKSNGSAKCQVRCVREGAQGVASIRAEPGAKVLRLSDEPVADAAVLASGREGRLLAAAPSPSLGVRSVLLPPSAAARVEVDPMDPPNRMAPGSTRQPVSATTPASRANAAPSAPTTTSAVVYHVADEFNRIHAAPTARNQPRPMGARSEWLDPLVLALFAYSALALLIAVIVLASR